MKEIIVKPAEQSDSEEIVRWLAENGSVEYIKSLNQNVQILKAQNSKTLEYLISHKAVILDALAPNPNATDIDRAECIRQLVKAAVYDAARYGIKELWFIGDDLLVNRIAQRHDFERIDIPVYRLRVP